MWCLPARRVDYGYDVTGKRIFKQNAPTGASESTEVYIYAGPNCVAEYVFLAEPDSPNVEFVYGQGIDSLVLVDTGEKELAVLRNQQWSITALVDNANGDVVERYAYDHFGKRTILDDAGVEQGNESDYKNPYGYTSRRHDHETGLMYFRARYYHPKLGQFISRDPLGYVDGMSQYRGYFVPGGADPTGLVVFDYDGSDRYRSHFWFPWILARAFEFASVVGHPYKEGKVIYLNEDGERKRGYGSTGRSFDVNCSCERLKPCDGKCCYRLHCKVTVETWITLDLARLEQAEKAKKTSRGFPITKRSVYGHEQRHALANRWTAIQAWAAWHEETRKDLKLSVRPLFRKEFPSHSGPWCRKHAARSEEFINEKLGELIKLQRGEEGAEDNGHDQNVNWLNPIASTPYELLGIMPSPSN